MNLISHKLKTIHSIKMEGFAIGIALIKILFQG